jgi:hypothetical protein
MATLGRDARDEAVSLAEATALQREGEYKRKGRHLSIAAFVEIIPAVTYSPTQLPMQYHRR